MLFTLHTPTSSHIAINAYVLATTTLLLFKSTGHPADESKSWWTRVEGCTVQQSINWFSLNTYALMFKTNWLRASKRSEDSISLRWLLAVWLPSNSFLICSSRSHGFSSLLLKKTFKAFDAAIVKKAALSLSLSEGNAIFSSS